MLKFHFLFLYSFLATILSAQEYCIDGRFNNYLFDSTQVQVISDIQYGESKNISDEIEQLKLDMYFPDTAIDVLDKKPLIVFIHGGGLTGGDKAAAGSIIVGQDFAQRGFIVASVNYRLGWNDIGSCEGDTTSLELAIYRALQDSKASVRFLKENAGEYGIDTNYIFLIGSSVGSALAIYTAYAEQENFPAYLYDSLGSLDSSTNILFDQSTKAAGIILKAGGVQYPEILNNTNIPVQFFHGTCDDVVPYNEGPLYSCNVPVKYPYFFGGGYLSKYMLEKNTPYELYTNEGLGHETADDDTITLYAGNFIKNILCNTLPLSAEYYRFNNGGCLTEDDEDVKVRFFPNPFQDYLNIEIESSVFQNIVLTIFNTLGQKIYSSSFTYLPPYMKFEVSTDSFLKNNGLYLANISGESFTNTEIIYKQK